MENLRYLNLTGLSFSGRLPPQLGNLSKMQYLAIGQDGHSEEMYSNDITWLTNQHSLKLLSILKRCISLIPQCFVTLYMSYLLLSNNSLSGTFPAFLQNGTSLEFLDLAWNKFYGRIPTWIGELTRLRFVRLSHNAFSGTIPLEITTLNYLQYLDLSRNNISGVIPLCLSNLTTTQNGFMPISGTDGTEIRCLAVGEAPMNSTVPCKMSRWIENR
jgi:hypothetical protein